MRKTLIQRAMESGEIKVAEIKFDESHLKRSENPISFWKINRKRGSGSQLNRYKVIILDRLLAICKFGFYLYDPFCKEAELLDIKKKDSERDVLRKVYQRVRGY